MSTVEQQLLTIALRNRAKFPHNKALPRVGNNRKRPHKAKERRLAAIARHSRQKNRG